MNRLRSLPLLALIPLTACASTGAITAAPMGTAQTAYSNVGLERVIGQNASGLVRLLGDPNADVREASARKLQFGSGICVLDAYLYPKGSDEQRVTYVDARQPDGSPIDRASCVAALTRRGGGK